MGRETRSDRVLEGAKREGAKERERERETEKVLPTVDDPRADLRLSGDTGPLPPAIADTPRVLHGTHPPALPESIHHAPALDGPEPPQPTSLGPRVRMVLLR